MIDVLIVLAALAVALAFGAWEQRRLRRDERDWRAGLRRQVEARRALERMQDRRP